MNPKYMLELGEFCGLQTVREAYSNAMMHYDAFFTISNYEEEVGAFHNELKEAGLLVLNDEGYFVFPEMSIKDALESLK